MILMKGVLGMKNALRGYRAFFPKSWMIWIVCVMYPVVAVAGITVFQYLNSEASIYIFLAAVYGVLAVEMVLSKYSFAGLVAKDSNRMEYLKTSVKGMDFLREVLITDQNRRFITTGVIVLSAGLMGVNHEYRIAEELSVSISVSTVLGIFLLISILVELLTFCMKLVNNTNAYTLMSMASFGIAGIMTFLLIVFDMESGHYLWISVILLMMYIVIRYVTRHTLLKKARAGYYD